MLLAKVRDAGKSITGGTIGVANASPDVSAAKTDCTVQKWTVGKRVNCSAFGDN